MATSRKKVSELDNKEFPNPNDLIYLSDSETPSPTDKNVTIEQLEAAIGGGGGISTLVENPDFERGTTGWTATGSITIGRTDVPGEILIGDGSGVITTSANVGETVDAQIVDFDRAFQYNKIQCEVYVEFNDTYVDKSVELYLLCDATEVYIGVLDNTDQIGRFLGYCNPVPGASDYKLRFKTATGVANGSTLTIDDVVIRAVDVMNISQPMLTAQAIEMDYTVGPNVDNVKVTTGSVDRTITIPAGFPVGRKIKIQKVDSGTGKVNIVSADTLPATLTLTSQWDFWEPEKCTDTAWALVGGYETITGANEGIKHFSGAMEQWDWGYFLGSGTIDYEIVKNVTAFVDENYNISREIIGFKYSVPASPSDIAGVVGETHGERNKIVTSSQFSIGWIASGAFSNTAYFLYTWKATGRWY